MDCLNKLLGKVEAIWFIVPDIIMADYYYY